MRNLYCDLATYKAIIFEHVIATATQSKAADRPRTVVGARLDSRIHFPDSDVSVTIDSLPDGTAVLVGHLHGSIAPDTFSRVPLSGKLEDWRADGLAVWDGAHELAARVCVTLSWRPAPPEAF